MGSQTEAERDRTARIAVAVAEFERLRGDGDDVDIDAMCARYPDVADELRRELEIVEILEDTAGSSPTMGERFGQYRLGSELGRGGMGAVFAAHDEDLNRDVALKVVAVDPLRLERVERFLREARALARIRHPHVVEVYAFGRSDRWTYLVMELLEGSLREHMSKASPALVVRWIRQAAEGVSYCHERGIVHRDLKPANLLLDADGVVKVADFGIARIDDLPGLTRTGHAWGTRGFVAPEIVAGDEADARSDVYALGACLYAMLAGGTPSDRGALQLPSTTPRALRRIITTAMAERPSDRYSDAASLVAALRTLEDPAALADRRRRRWPVGVGVVVATLAAATGQWMRSSSGPASPTQPSSVPTATALPAGGYVIQSYHRWFDRPITDGARELAAVWDRKLAALVSGRALSRVQALAFDQGGTTYRASLQTDGRELVLSLRADDELRGEVRLPERVAVGVHGWGIFHETLDEDGDGRKDIVLVKVSGELAMVRVVKFDPHAWIGSEDWRRAPPADARYAAPAVVGGELQVALERSGPKARVRVETLDPRTGRVIDLRSLDGVTSVGAAELGSWTASTRLGATMRGRVPDVAPEWRWRFPAGHRPRVAAWNAPRRDVLVGGDATGFEVRGFARPVTSDDPYVRERLEQSGSALLSAGGDAVCSGGTGFVVCVRIAPGLSQPKRLAWRVRLPRGERVEHRPVLLPGTPDQLAVVTREGGVFIVGGSGVARDVRLPFGAPVGPPVVTRAGRCVFVATRAAVYCVPRAGDGEASTIARSPSQSRWSSAPRVLEVVTEKGRAQHLMLSRTGGRGHGLQLVRVRDGAVVWSLASEGPPRGAPVVQLVQGRARVYFTDAAGALYASWVRLPGDARVAEVR